MIPCERYHGTGNAFLVVEADRDVGDRTAFGVRACADEGVDGVLFLGRVPGEVPTVEMTLVQPDGSRAAMCGNGARVAARWALGARDGGDGEVLVRTPAGDRPAFVEGDHVTVEMGAVSFDPRAVPLAPDRDAPLVEETVEGLTVTAVNTGVPHAVAVVEDVDAVDLATVAPPVRHAAVFPEGANVTLAARRGDGGFDQRTFERGVEAETAACGTGAVAVAAVAERLGLAPPDEPLAVHPPGGELSVTVREDGTATLAGPTVREGAGTLPRVEGEP